MRGFDMETLQLTVCGGRRDRGEHAEHQAAIENPAWKQSVLIVQVTGISTARDLAGFFSPVRCLPGS